jgi:hypothetical protein
VEVRQKFQTFRAFNTSSVKENSRHKLYMFICYCNQFVMQNFQKHLDRNCYYMNILISPLQETVSLLEYVISAVIVGMMAF